MSVSLGVTQLGGSVHGTIKPGPWEYARSVQSFFGVVGEVHLQGRLRGRDLTCWLLLENYSSHANLQAAIETINGLISTSGTVTWVFNGDSDTYADCVFNGFVPDEDPWLDASGVNDWCCKGQLTFRQIKT